MSRILFMHERAIKRGGRACSPRLSLQDWNAECNRVALCGHIYDVMEAATDENGDALFTEAARVSVLNRAVEGCLEMHVFRFHIDSHSSHVT